MYKIIKAQWYKTLRTPVSIILLVCPLLFSFLLLLYCKKSTYVKGIELNVFFLLFTIVATFSLSFFIPMIYESDREACSYANELRIGRSRSSLFISRFILIIILLAIIEIFAVILFIMGGNLFLDINFNYIQLVNYFFIFYLTSFPMIIIYQFMTLRFNYVGSILLGSFISLSSILLGTTNLGELFWKWLPFVWGIKINSIYGNSISDVNIYFYLLLSLVFTAFLMIIFIFWYNRWSGQTQLEE